MLKSQKLQSEGRMHKARSYWNNATSALLTLVLFLPFLGCVKPAASSSFVERAQKESEIASPSPIPVSEATVGSDVDQGIHHRCGNTDEVANLGHGKDAVGTILHQITMVQILG